MKTHREKKNERMYLESFGRFLVYCRTSISCLGLTRQRVAERMGVSVSLIRRLERGRHDPTLSTLRRYFGAIECIGSYELKEKK